MKFKGFIAGPAAIGADGLAAAGQARGGKDAVR
jgi:hypothetical protein